MIYQAVVGRPWYRLRVLPAVVKHLTSILALIADGVNAHVPEADRKVDARTLLHTHRMKLALKQLNPFGAKASTAEFPGAFDSVPRKQSLVAGARLLMSQTPFHNPAHSPLPELAGRWFERWDSGGDVTRWYSAETAG